MTTTAQIKFAGDDSRELMSVETARLAITALSNAKTYLIHDPKAAEQAGAAVEAANALLNAPVPKGEHRLFHLTQEPSLALVAALIVIEYTLSDDLDGEGDDVELGKLHDDTVRALRGAGYRLIEKTFKHAWIPFDIFVVAMDETEYCVLPDAWKEHVERVEAVYFFDRNSVTHICSFTGSYYFHHLENRVIWKDGFEPSDELNSEAFDYFQGGGDEESGYHDESDVEQFLVNHAAKPFRVHHFGNPGIDLDETLESVENDEDWRQRHDHKRTGEALEKVMAQFREGGHFEEAVERRIFETVRESLSANPVL